MKASLFLIATIVLTACASPDDLQLNARPKQVILYANSLNVIMSENSLCVGHRPGRATEWTGYLSGCRFQYAYLVNTAPGSSTARQVLQNVPAPVTTAKTSVTISDARGNSYFFMQD